MKRSYHEGAARLLPTPVKLTFEDREPLQLMLAAVGKTGGAAAAVEKETGTAIHVRGNVVTVEGPQGALVERLLRQLYALAQSGSPLSPTDIMRAVEVLKADPGASLGDVFDDTVLERPVGGRPIAPRSLAQKRYVAYMRRHALTFGVGPAGTGKTFLAMAMAVHQLVEKDRFGGSSCRARRSRPASASGSCRARSRRRSALTCGRFTTHCTT